MADSKHRKETRKKAAHDESSPGGEGRRPLTVGVIGWNSPRFVEAHAPFIELLKRAVASHGAQPFFYGISGVSDILPAAAADGHPAANGSDAGRIANYGLPARDMVADQIEIVVHQENLGGLLMVPWSVSSLVGMMMAAIRCGVPALFMPCYRRWGLFPGAAPGPTYSQCSMLVVLEVFGLTKLGAIEQLFPKKEKGAAAAAQAAECEPDEVHFAEWAGRRAVEMAKQNISPRRFFSQAAFQNAVSVDMALGNSCETVLHLSALAYESGVPLPLSLFNDGSKRIPQLVPVNRAGEFSMAEFQDWGGLPGLLGAIATSLQPSPMVIGKNIVEVAREHAAMRSSYKMSRPFRKHGGLGVLFGNLAREGAIFRVAGLKESSLVSSGPARVFDSEAACRSAIASKKIKKGEVIVLRYAGPKGSPGMPSLDAVERAIEDRGLGDSVVFLTDGRLTSSGRTPAFVHVSPEAAAGSALSVLQDGDIIFWNFFDKALSVRLTDTEIKVRLSRWKEQEKNMRNSFLYRYSKYTSSSSYGATLV